MAEKSKLTSSLNLFFIFICLFGLFLAACEKSKEANSTSQISSSLGTARNEEEEPIPVKVVKAHRGDFILRLRAPAEAVAERKATIKSAVSGLIKKLYVREGQHVQVNDLLAEIEDTPYRLQLQQKEANRLRALSELFLEQRFSESSRPLSPEIKEKIKAAREEYEKAASLFGQGIISLEEYDRLKREYEFLLLESGEMKHEVMAAAKGLTQAEIEVQIAKLQLEKTKIKAPFSGIITNIRVSPQENVEIGRELFTLVDLTSVKLVAQILESEIGRVKPGQEVEIKFVAYPEQRYEGKVEAVSPLINPEDKTCQVHVAVANPKEEIKPGMHAEVEIAAIVLPHRLLVPQKAVLTRGGRKLLFVVEDNLAKWRYIEVGAENEAYVEILDGVREGEKVIIEGHLTLAHDARVKIENKP